MNQTDRVYSYESPGWYSYKSLVVYSFESTVDLMEYRVDIIESPGTRLSILLKPRYCYIYISNVSTTWDSLTPLPLPLTILVQSCFLRIFPFPDCLPRIFLFLDCCFPFLDFFLCDFLLFSLFFSLFNKCFSCLWVFLAKPFLGNFSQIWTLGWSRSLLQASYILLVSFGSEALPMFTYLFRGSLQNSSWLEASLQ